MPSNPAPSVSTDTAAPAPTREVELAIRRATTSAPYHWTLLTICSVVVVLSVLLSTSGPEQVILPIINQPIPGLCMSKRITGLDCPGCGMTRSFVSMAHGDLLAAWRFNPAGILFFVVVAAQVPLRSLQLWQIHRGRALLPLWRLHGLLWVVVAVLLIQWAIKIAGIAWQSIAA